MSNLRAVAAVAVALLLLASSERAAVREPEPLGLAPSDARALILELSRQPISSPAEDSPSVESPRPRVTRHPHRMTVAPCPSVRAGFSHFAPRAPVPGERFETEEGVASAPYSVARVATLRLASHRLAVVDGSGPLPGDTELVDVGVESAPVLALLPPNRVDSAIAYEVLVSEQPVSYWVDDSRLGFGTDGGTGAVESAEGGAVWQEDLQADVVGYEAVSDALARGRCAGMDNHGGRGADVIFMRTFGDGGFPALVGYDDHGAMASIVILTDVAPWALMGLTGQPPGFIAEELQAHGLPVPPRP